MYFKFASALVAACAFAQDVVEESNPLLEIFQMNEGGQWQLDILPNIPTISFTDVPDEQIQEWIEGKQAESDVQAQKWEEAWSAYETAIAEPWNNFLDTAEQLSAEDIQQGMQTDEEVIRFIANNTFIDGSSLTSSFPGIEQFLAEYRAQADNTQVNFDQLRIPVMMQMGGYYDEEGNYHPNEVIQEWSDGNGGTMVSGYWDEDGNYVANDDMYYDNQAMGEQIKDALENSIVSYGYDPEVVQAWLQDKETTWQELEQASAEIQAAQAKADVAEAADYVKDILDNMIIDLRARQVAETEMLDDWLNQMQADIDSQAQENIDKLSQWIDQAYNDVQSAVEQSDSAQISLAHDTDVAGEFENPEAIGYGTMGLGAAAVLAYLYKKQLDSKAVNMVNEDDEDFQRVVHDQLMDIQEHDEDFIRVEEDDFEM